MFYENALVFAVIIAQLNAFFLVAVLRNLYRVTKDKTRSKEGKPKLWLFWYEDQGISKASMLSNL